MIDNNELLAAEQTARDLEKLIALGDDNLAAGISIDDKTSKVSRKEACHLFAVDLYRKAQKCPSTNLLHREDAGKILGVLGAMHDNEVVETFCGMRQYLSQPVSEMSGALARMLQILVSRRGLRSMAADYDRGIQHLN